MKRNYHANDFITSNHEELKQRIAYHEAGHATAIYLYNKQKQLPPIFFEISFKSNKNATKNTDFLKQDNVAAKVEGGCLIQNLILSFIESQYYMTASEKADYYTALNADIINLLAGSIAEANYVSLRDNEVINADLLSIEALKNYGSDFDFAKINEYLACISECPQQQRQKLNQLLSDAYEFLTHPKTWKAVKAVANFILTSQKQTISCEEVFSIIDAITVTYS
jgi:hypothetical protein